MKKLIILSMTLLASYVANTSAFQNNRVFETFNQAANLIPTPVYVADPVTYFQTKNRAIKLAKQKQWHQVNILTKRLTNEFQYDGDTWYLLGLSDFAQANYHAAIAPLEQALALGVSLKGIPTGASNPNDLMIKIAEAFAEQGDQANAQLWLKKALDARWDDRPTLAGRSLFSSGVNPHFQRYAHLPVYKELAGNNLVDDLNRDEKWRYDLAFLVAEIKRLHVAMYHKITPAQFNKKVHEIEQSIPKLSDQQIVFQFMELIAMLGNGHNLLIPAWGESGNFKQLPFQFYQFNDGLFIIAATSDYQHYIGYEVIAFADTPASEALALTQKVNASDNGMQTLWLGPYYLSLVEVLHGLGLTNDKTPSLTLKSAQGELVTISPASLPMQFSGFPKLPKLAQYPEQRYLSKNTTPYWSEVIDNNMLLYVQFNDVRNAKEQSLAQFAEQLQAQLKSDNIEHMVLDLRHNSGGNGSLTPPLVATAAFFKVFKPNGKLFVLVGRNTYSAGHDVAVKIANIVPTIFVGEPSGTRPNVIGEAGWFNLPYSKQAGLISSQFHQQSRAEDHRIWISPDIPVSLTSVQYFSGKDPALEAILAITMPKQIDK